MTQPVELPRAQITQIAATLWGDPGSVSIVPMVGGASTRKFARVSVGSNPPVIAMYVPEAHGSDEIVKQSGPTARWPFLEVRDLLAGRGVRVPAIVHEACAEGLLFVEDLGDQTLAVALEQHPHLRTKFYQTAVADLARAQQALQDLPENSIVSTRRFDRDLLRWEVEHFREWALGARSVKLTKAEDAVFAEAADFLASTIAQFPPCFVHRDYQSRNIMVRLGPGDEIILYWIDFQDALLGPRAYDLVALLGDSYQVFTPEFVEARLSEYATLKGLDGSARKQLSYEFDLVTVQRKLKDAGRFIYVDRVKNNPAFLDFVEPTVDKVMAALKRLTGEPVLGRLADVLTTVLGRG